MDWTPQEAEQLQNAWRLVIGLDRLRLVSPCPWCLHDNAFPNAVVSNSAPVPGGGAAHRDPGFAPAQAGTFPGAGYVQCLCKQHGDKDGGCGREGYVPIPESAWQRGRQ